MQTTEIRGKKKKRIVMSLPLTFPSNIAYLPEPNK
jgi:hypothetical protein